MKNPNFMERRRNTLAATLLAGSLAIAGCSSGESHGLADGKAIAFGTSADPSKVQWDSLKHSIEEAQQHHDLSSGELYFKICIATDPDPEMPYDGHTPLTDDQMEKVKERLTDKASSELGMTDYNSDAAFSYPDVQGEARIVVGDKDLLTCAQ